jgi:acetyl-CoA synthetase (ADP-forming)
MLKSIKESPIYPIANPKSIAFFGASNNISAMGTNLLASLLALGFEGEVFPVHPREREVQGLKSYQTVLELPCVPDMAVIVLPTRIVPEIMEACGKKGIKHAIVVSGGFKEVGGKGVDLEEELRQVADRYGIRFLGPNCIGVANPHHKLNTTFMEFEGAPGFIGLASQSGSFVTQMFDYLSRFSLGFSTAVSVGNEANVDLVECMEYLGACPNTKVIALYIEGIKRGKAFLETARAIASEKPIVALYVGGSEAGKRAAFSHTGAMAGPDRLYDGLFRQSGIIRAQSMTELFDFCWVLGSVPLPRGPRVVIQTHSGGPGAAAADACGRSGLELPDLSKESLEKLSSLVPHTGSLKNPVDLTFNKNPLDYFSRIPAILLEEENADILLMYLHFPTAMVRRMLAHMGLTEAETTEQAARVIDMQAESLVRLMDSHGKPLVGYTFQSLREKFMMALLARGLPVLPSPERAARALGALVQYACLRDRFSWAREGEGLSWSFRSKRESRSGSPS